MADITLKPSKSAHVPVEVLDNCVREIVTGVANVKLVGLGVG